MRRYRTLFIPERGFKGQINTTWKQYNRHLGYLSQWLEDQGLTIKKMTAEHWDQFIEYRGWGYKTERLMLSAIRYWLRYTRKQNRLQKLWAKVLGDHPLFKVEWPQGERKPQRTLTISQRDQLLEVAKTLRNPERDTALIRLLWDVWGRKFEIADALWENVDVDNRFINLLTKAEDLKPRQWELKRFFPETEKALREWKKLAPVGDTVFGLEDSGITMLFRRLSAKVGFRVSTHDFRRGIISHMTENRVSDTLGMQQTGTKTHRIYARYGEGARLKALDDQIWKSNES